MSSDEHTMRNNIKEKWHTEPITPLRDHSSPIFLSPQKRGSRKFQRAGRRYARPRVGARRAQFVEQWQRFTGAAALLFQRFIYDARYLRHARSPACVVPVVDGIIVIYVSYDSLWTHLYAHYVLNDSIVVYSRHNISLPAVQWNGGTGSL